MVWLYFLLIYVLAPVGIAKGIVRATNKEVVAAYGLLYGLLAFWLFAGYVDSGGSGEHAGWFLILSIFVTTPGVPAFALALRLFGFLRREKKA